MTEIGGWAGQNLGPIIAALATGGVIVKALDLWASRRGRDASTDVLLSAEARAIAGDLRAELAAERTERRRVEGRVDELEAELSAERRRCAGLEARVAELERLIRRSGLSLPGDTPPSGTPAAGTEA